jgi:adenine-specific DNA-methyltransferase
MGTNSKVNELYLERILAQVLEDFPHYDEKVGKRFKTAPLHARGIRKGETGKPWRGIKPPLGNHWRYIHATLDALDKAKLIEWSDTGNPRKKIYAEDSEGYAVQDIWDFKDPGDRLASYPTEKSEYLLNHIIRASSSPGDIVLDAFSGSGTTLAVAEKLGRRWIGIDCGKFAIYSIQKRLLNLRAEIGNFIELPARDLTASQAFFETVFGMTNDRLRADVCMHTHRGTSR